MASLSKSNPPISLLATENLEIVATFLGTRSLLSMLVVSKSMHAALTPMVVSLMRAWVVAAVTRKIGPGGADFLFSMLDSDCIASYRFCGGMMVSWCLDTFPPEPNDIDVYVVPANEEAIEAFMLSATGVSSVIDYAVTSRTPGRIHDIKIAVPNSVVYSIDLVMRHEVAECASIDIPVCKSGFFKIGGKYGFEAVDRALSLDRLMRVPSTIAEARYQKYLKKGYGVFIMDL